MEDIGSLVFYIILGIIALAGSIQGKGKKKQGAPKPVQRKPAPSARRPGEGRVTASAPPENRHLSGRTARHQNRHPGSYPLNPQWKEDTVSLWLQSSNRKALWKIHWQKSSALKVQ